MSSNYGELYNNLPKKQSIIENVTRLLNSMNNLQDSDYTCVVINNKTGKVCIQKIDTSNVGESSGGFCVENTDVNEHNPQQKEEKEITQQLNIVMDKINSFKMTNRNYKTETTFSSTGPSHMPEHEATTILVHNSEVVCSGNYSSTNKQHANKMSHISIYEYLVKNELIKQ